MNPDIIGEIAKHITAYSTLCRGSIASSVCKNAMKEKVRVLRYRRVVRFIAKMWLDRTRMRTMSNVAHVRTWEIYALIVKSMCWVESPMDDGLDTSISNIAMIAVHLPDTEEKVVEIKVVVTGIVISSSKHNVIPGFPIFHTLEYGVFPALCIQDGVKIRVKGSNGKKIIPLSIFSYGYAELPTQQDNMHSIAYGPFAINNLHVKRRVTGKDSGDNKKRHPYNSCVRLYIPVDEILVRMSDFFP